MDIFKKLIDEGKITEEELAQAIKNLAGSPKKEETWQEKHDALIEKNKKQAEENAKNVAQIKKNFRLNRKGKLLATIVNKFGERTYSLEEISRMPSYQIDELFEMYAGIKDLETRPLTEEEERKYERLTKSITADGEEKSASAYFDDTLMNDEVKEEKALEEEKEEKTEEEAKDETKEEQVVNETPVEEKEGEQPKVSEIEPEEPKKVKYITNIKNWTKNHGKLAGALAAVVVVAGVVFGVPVAFGTTAGELAAIYIASKSTLGKHK